MANWKYTLDLTDLWIAYEEHSITVSELGKKVAERIKAHKLYTENEYELEDIIDQFENLVDDVEDFDVALHELYDWADQEVEPLGKWPRNAMCWVKTC